MSPRSQPLRAALLVGLVGLVALFAGCSSPGPAISSGRAIAERVEGEAAEQLVGPELLAEFDAFTDAQRLPEDPDSPLTAVTPEQEAFITDPNAAAEERTRLEAELTEILARGASYLCPEDGARWTAAADEVYSD